MKGSVLHLLLTKNGQNVLVIYGMCPKGVKVAFFFFLLILGPASKPPISFASMCTRVYLLLNPRTALYLSVVAPPTFTWPPLLKVPPRIEQGHRPPIVSVFGFLMSVRVMVMGVGLW